MNIPDDARECKAHRCWYYASTTCPACDNEQAAVDAETELSRMTAVRKEQILHALHRAHNVMDRAIREYRESVMEGQD